MLTYCYCLLGLASRLIGIWNPVSSIYSVLYKVALQEKFTFYRFTNSLMLDKEEKDCTQGLSILFTLFVLYSLPPLPVCITTSLISWLVRTSIIILQLNCAASLLSKNFFHQYYRLNASLVFKSSHTLRKPSNLNANTFISWEKQEV